MKNSDMLKAGLIPPSRINWDTKVIYESDDHVTIAQKIVRAFDIGDLVKVTGISTVQFMNYDKIIPIPDGICCPIIGKPHGFYICYPKGFMTVRYLMMLDRGLKEFKWRIAKTEQDKHYYEIWRSK